MGTKSVSFGYLEFSRAIRRNHAHTRAPLLLARRQGRVTGHGRRCECGCNPAPFFLNQATWFLCYSGSRPDLLYYPRAALEQLQRFKQEQSQLSLDSSALPSAPLCGLKYSEKQFLFSYSYRIQCWKGFQSKRSDFVKKNWRKRCLLKEGLENSLDS